MNGEYSLLDQTILDKLNRQYQGTPTLTGVPSPSTAVPAISPELMQFGEKIGTPAPKMDWKQQAVKALQDFGPLISQVGTTLMKGRDIRTGAPTETAGSQIGGAITSALGTMKMNEALKKMISQQLSGKGGGAGFSEGQPVGLTGAETVGLTPEQVSSLYGTGLGLREKELGRPVSEMGTLALAELHLASAEKMRAEIADMPVKNVSDMLKQISESRKIDVAIQKMQEEILKIREETAETKARTGAIPTETERKEAETKKTVAEEKKITQELDPTFVARKKRLETMLGTKLTEVDIGTEKLLVNPITAVVVDRFKVEAKPETAGRKAAGELPIRKFAIEQSAPLMIPHLEAVIAAQPGGKNRLALQDLINSLRSLGTGEIDSSVVIARLSKHPELLNKYKRAVTAYMSGLESGESEAAIGTRISHILGTPGTAAPAAPVAEKPTAKKGILGRAKEVIAGREQIPEAFMTQMIREGPGTYESKSWKVVWDGTKVVSLKKKAAAPTLNYGTYTP